MGLCVNDEVRGSGGLGGVGGKKTINDKRSQEGSRPSAAFL